LFTELPWVTDLEFANELVGGNEIRIVRKAVQKCLSSKNCRRIMPWSDWSKRTLLHSMDCDSFREKIETIHLAVRPKRFVKRKSQDKITLLFVGSTNLSNSLNFEGKGGFEVIEAFRKLRGKYDNLELVVRSWVPPSVKAMYQKIPGLTIIDSPISEEALADLYTSADICVFPAHYNLGMAILEAMSYELPIIARGVYDVPEAVEDMETGLLLEALPDLPYYLWNGGPNCYDRNFLQHVRRHQNELVNQIVQKTSILIDDSSLRLRLGKGGRASIEQGKFSITNRNRRLKQIFDRASSVD
jgi:glycosyltransferase involved in cell wall biosynthesis